MKKTLAICGMALLALVACKQPATTSETATAPTPAAMPDFPYAIERPDNWVPGNLNNVVTVMKGLKAWENNDIDGCVAEFADSAMIEFDGLDAKMGKDSLKAFFAGGRAQFKSVQIVMNDWESVISKDKKDEYVSLWYKQIVTDNNGKVDSFQVMNDAKIENGKITLLNEKIRRYGTRK